MYTVSYFTMGWAVNKFNKLINMSSLSNIGNGLVGMEKSLCRMTAQGTKEPLLADVPLILDKYCLCGEVEI